MKVEQGMDLVLFGNIPNGSGLSSSASVEVLTGFILRDMFGFDVTNQDLALIGQYSEINSTVSTVVSWISLLSQWAKQAMRSSLTLQL